MNKNRIQALFGHILNVPSPTWVLLGFSMAYLFFFIYPIFLSGPSMQFFKYVWTAPMDPIGVDLKQMLSYSQSWFVDKQTPYIGANLYPPLASVLFTPLLIVKLSWAYKILTLVNVLCYVMITFVFPLSLHKGRQVSSLLMFVFITGLFSYGFQFELERGQFNIIAVFLCLLSIWICHYHNRYRFLAYILFSLSVQLKVYPLIFIVVFFSNWQDWKNNIKGLLVLATVNFALFFVLGSSVFIDFVKALLAQTKNPAIWVGNHSLCSFVTGASKTAAEHGCARVNEYSGLAQFALLAIIALCIFLIMLQAYRQKQKGINPHLLLACTLGALLIPSVSHDYKLSILAAPVALLLSNNRLWTRAMSPRLNMIFIVLPFIFSAAYSSTLFSFTNKPLILQNNFPALFTMLLAITFLSLMSKQSLESAVPKSIKTV